MSDDEQLVYVSKKKKGGKKPAAAAVLASMAAEPPAAPPAAVAQAAAAPTAAPASGAAGGASASASASTPASAAAPVAAPAVPAVVLAPAAAAPLAAVSAGPSSVERSSEGGRRVRFDDSTRGEADGGEGSEDEDVLKLTKGKAGKKKKPTKSFATEQDDSDEEGGSSGPSSVPMVGAHEMAALPKGRFYEKEFPDTDEVVFVNVQSIEEMGAYVTLLEYNNIQGMVLLSELSRRRIRSIHKLIRVGRNEIVMVIRVDRDKACIDLSKRRVTPEDRAKCEERYNKASLVHSIMGQMSLKFDTPMEDLCSRISWPLYRKFGHAYDAFQMAERDPERVFEGLVISDEEKKVLMKFIDHRMRPQELRIRSDIDVTCFEYEGVEAVRAALLAGRALSTPEKHVSIKLLASPTFSLVTTTYNDKEGIALLNDVIAAITTEIKKRKGNVIVKLAPTVATKQDEINLNAAALGADKQDSDESSSEEEA